MEEVGGTSLGGIELSHGRAGGFGRRGWTGGGNVGHGGRPVHAGSVHGVIILLGGARRRSVGGAGTAPSRLVFAVGGPRAILGVIVVGGVGGMTVIGRLGRFAIVVVSDLHVVGVAACHGGCCRGGLGRHSTGGKGWEAQGSPDNAFRLKSR